LARNSITGDVNLLQFDNMGMPVFNNNNNNNNKSACYIIWTLMMGYLLNSHFVWKFLKDFLKLDVWWLNRIWSLQADACLLCVSVRTDIRLFFIFCFCFSEARFSFLLSFLSYPSSHSFLTPAEIIVLNLQAEVYKTWTVTQFEKT